MYSQGHIQQYEPERVKPIYTYITKKYLCEEDVVRRSDQNPKDVNISTLTFHIKENDPSMVWKSVRLCLPLDVAANTQDKNVSMRMADNFPACNVALSASAYEMFSDIQLIVNGSMFTNQPNRYQGMLDRVYRGRDVLSFQSGGSLKPIVNRNLKKATETNGIYPIESDDEKNQYVQIHDTYSSVSANAFDLTQSNPGFITRAAQFQQEMNGAVYQPNVLATMYLDIGIFQNKERKLPSGRRQYNDACPYLRDVMVRFTHDKLRSNFDTKYDTKMASDLSFFHSRDMPSKFLEFATPVNSGIYGEPALPVSGWISSFQVSYTAKPYLEVQFVQVPEQDLKPQYSLMAIRHQHEISDIFHLEFTTPDYQDSFVKASVTQRINSRLLEVPSKIYLWAGLSFNDKKSFFLGNTGNQRYCDIKRLHLRMNTRSDALFEPTQLECYNIFKRLTFNDMNYQTWSRSPIYVFDPQALGQPEFLASDGQLMTFDWDCEISPTSLQYEEMLFLQDTHNLKSMGYEQEFTFSETFNLNFSDERVGKIRKYMNWIPNPGFDNQANNIPNTAQGNRPAGNHEPWGIAAPLVSGASHVVLNTKRQIQLAYYVNRDFGVTDTTNRQLYIGTRSNAPSIWNHITEGMFLKKFEPQIMRGVNVAKPVPEIWRLHAVLEHQVRFDNFVWGIWAADTNTFIDLCNNSQAPFWYVPESWPFSMVPTDYGYTRDSDGNWYNKQIFCEFSDLEPRPNGTWKFKDDHIPVDDAGQAGKGIIKGVVTMQNSAGEVVKLKFNKLEAAPQDFGVCPGPRAYPLSIQGAGAAKTLHGIRNIGMPDGGGGTVNAGIPANDVVRGGIAPENWEATQNLNNITYYKYLQQKNTAAGPDGYQNYYWVAFQPTLDMVSGTNVATTFVAWNDNAIATANFPGVNAVAAPCGSVSRVVPTAVAGNALGRAEAPQEVHIVRQVIERNVAGSQEGGGVQYTYYDLRDNNQGAIMASSGQSTKDKAITDSLEFSLNVLYEFGNEKYIVSKNGQLVQDNDVWTPTVVQKRARVAAERLELPDFTQDPRLKRALPEVQRQQVPRADGFHNNY